MLALAVALSLAACIEQPAPTDKVRTAEEAISIAKKVCGALTGNHAGVWNATLYDGMWATHFTSGRGFPGCDWIGGDVRASDGEFKACSVCVVAN